MEDAYQFIVTTIPSRARFVGRYLGYTTFSSVSIGLVCGQLGAVLQCGPLLPFIGGAWIGYSAACVNFWRLEAGRALEYIRRYPRLMEHAMRIEFSEWSGIHDGVSIGEWVQGGGRLGRLGRLSWAILAAQSAQPSVDEIQEAQRARIVQDCSELAAGDNES